MRSYPNSTYFRPYGLPLTATWTKAETVFGSVSPKMAKNWLMASEYHGEGTAKWHVVTQMFLFGRVKSSANIRIWRMAMLRNTRGTIWRSCTISWRKICSWMTKTWMGEVTVGSVTHRKTDLKDEFEKNDKKTKKYKKYEKKTWSQTNQNHQNIVNC